MYIIIKLLLYNIYIYIYYKYINIYIYIKYDIEFLKIIFDMGAKHCDLDSCSCLHQSQACA